MKKIIFICSGNTCRSPMAEYIGNSIAKDRRLDYQFYSAGLHAFPGDGATVNSRKVMSEIGLDLSHHRSKNVEELDEFDYIIPMTQNIKTELNVFFPQLEQRILPISEFNKGRDISDPYGGDVYTYESTRDEIYAAVENVIKFLGGKNEDSNRV